MKIVREKGIRFHHISTDEVFGSLDLNSNKKFNYARAFSREFLSHNFLMIGSKSITGKFVNFADFGVFNISILRENRFDETFINGWEDWDLSYKALRIVLGISFSGC